MQFNQQQVGQQRPRLNELDDPHSLVFELDSLSQSISHHHQLDGSAHPLDQVLSLFNRLSTLIHHLTDELHRAEVENQSLRSDLKISESNLILTESAIESLEHQIHKLHTRNETIEEDKVSIRNRDEKYRMKALLGDDKVMMSSRRPSSASGRLNRSTHHSAGSSLFSILTELDQLQSDHSNLLKRYQTLQSDHSSLIESKKNLELEIENLSIELFQEANQMVRIEKVKNQALENKLKALSASDGRPLHQIQEEEQEMKATDHEDMNQLSKTGPPPTLCLSPQSKLKPLLLPTGLNQEPTHQERSKHFIKPRSISSASSKRSSSSSSFCHSPQLHHRSSISYSRSSSINLALPSTPSSGSNSHEIQDHQAVIELDSNLDELLVSILDCAQSLGIQDELEGIFS